MEEWESNAPRGRNERGLNNNDNRNRNRGNYRRRSRSRSPRNPHIRHRPYHDYRFSNNGGGGGGSSNSPSGSSGGFQQGQNQNAAQLFHQLTNNYNNQRFYMERMDNYQPYFPNNFPNNFSGSQQQHAPNYNTRCFVCGSGEHLARFCPRR